MQSIETQLVGDSKRAPNSPAKSKALEVARTLEKASSEARRGTLTEARTRDLLSEVLQSINGEGLHVFTLVDWFDHFVKGKRKSSAVATGKRHDQMMREFVEFLGPRSQAQHRRDQESRHRGLPRRSRGARTCAVNVERRAADDLCCVQRCAQTRPHLDQSMPGNRTIARQGRSAKLSSRRSKSARSSKLPQAIGRG